MFTFFHFPDSGLNLLNGFDFCFDDVTVKTSNRHDEHRRYFLRGVSQGFCHHKWNT